MVLKLVNKSNNDLPRYETELSAGMDVRSFIESPIILKPFERKLVNTGLYAQLEKGYEIQGSIILPLVPLIISSARVNACNPCKLSFFRIIQ